MLIAISKDRTNLAPEKIKPRRPSGGGANPSQRPHDHPLLEGNHREAAGLTHEPLEVMLPHTARSSIIDPCLGGHGAESVGTEHHIAVAMPRYHAGPMVTQGDLVRREAHHLRGTLALDGAKRLAREESFSRLEVVGDAHDTIRFWMLHDGQDWNDQQAGRTLAHHLLIARSMPTKIQKQERRGNLSARPRLSTSHP